MGLFLSSPIEGAADSYFGRGSGQLMHPFDIHPKNRVITNQFGELMGHSCEQTQGDPCRACGRLVAR